MKKLGRFFAWVFIIVILLAGLAAWIWPDVVQSGIRSAARDGRVMSWLQNSGANPDWAVVGGERCGTAPFLLPTSGYIGYLWDDSFRPGHRHSGLDIFGGGNPGDTAVMAAYDGYLTRLPEWKSSVIQRIPSDPLNPTRQVWLYYTHMADPGGNSLVSVDFPPGASEIFVTAGTLLGYQGNFSGTPGVPTGVHLHFSIVRDDGTGNFLNELDINNTIDPSPYLGITVNVHRNPPEIPVCP
jgi:peptidoglycan LD-endopeptidase LytH